MSRPILITGIHRSGSTWLGEMVSLSSQVGYIHEPFNFNHGKCLCGYQLSHWYEKVSPGKAKMFRKHFRHLLRFGSQEVLSDLLSGRFKKVGVQVRRGQIDPVSWIMSHRPLVKDPLALMSADWLYENFNTQNIISIRHPAAFVDSLVRKKWSFNFGNLANQPDLMSGRLVKWAPMINEYANGQPDLQEQAILLWNVVYDVVRQYREEHSEWYYLRHEDVSSAPEEELRKLYDHLGLEYTEGIDKKVKEFTNPVKENARQRNSRDNIYRWKKNLTSSQISTIRKGTEEVSHHFYTSDNW